MQPSSTTSVRIAPATALPDDLAAALGRLMAGAQPLRLFTTVGRDPRLLRTLFGGGMLAPGNLTMREREIVIHRVTAACGAGYEFGVHAAYFARAAGLGPEALASLADLDRRDGGWAANEAALIALCDSLHATCTVSDLLWSRLKEHFADEALIEALMLAGYYRMISYLCNGLALPNEPGTGPIPAPAGGTSGNR